MLFRSHQGVDHRKVAHLVEQTRRIVLEVKIGVPHHYTVERHSVSSGVHESEWRWIGGDIDHVIYNDKTVDELKENLIRRLAVSFGSGIIGEMK